MLFDPDISRPGFLTREGAGLSSVGGGVTGQDVVDLCQCRA